MEEDQHPSGAEVGVRRGPSLEEAPGWRKPVLLGRRPPAIIPASSKTPRELRELERYLVLALALVGSSLLLTLLDETRNVAYVAAMRSIIILGVSIVCLLAIVRLRKARHGLVRTRAPSARDALTGLPDERYFWLRLREEHARTRRYGEPFSVAILDVNDLASVNRAHGDAAGDGVLTHVARIIDSAKRSTDVAVRLTDDEFALILLECNRDGAFAFSQRLQQYLSSQPASMVLDGRALELAVAVSIGFAAVTDRETSAEELVARARHNLAAAKEESGLGQERWAI